MGLANKEFPAEWENDPGVEEHELLKGKNEVFLISVSLAQPLAHAH